MDLDLSSYIHRIQQEDDIFTKAKLLHVLTDEYKVPIKDIAPVSYTHLDVYKRQL